MLGQKRPLPGAAPPSTKGLASSSCAKQIEGSEVLVLPALGVRLCSVPPAGSVNRGAIRRVVNRLEAREYVEYDDPVREAGLDVLGRTYEDVETDTDYRAALPKIFFSLYIYPRVANGEAMTRHGIDPGRGQDGIDRGSHVAGGEPVRGELGHEALDAHDGGADHAKYDTGTTVVGLAVDGAVVMAADRRMSLGGRFTANKSVQKVEQVHPTAAMGISGSVGPAQDLLRSLRAEASLYESRRGEPMSLNALAQTAGGLIRGLPVTPLLGGVDAESGENGTHDGTDRDASDARIYELDGSGSVLADDYAATGSGMQVAYGVLERRYDPDASVEGATEAAVAAVAAASERDTASGNGCTVTTITAEGVETVAHEADDIEAGVEEDDAGTGTGEVA